MPVGRRRFTRAGVFARPPVEWNVSLPAGQVGGSSTISGAVTAVNATSNVDLPAGTVTASSTVSGSLVVGATLPAGTVTGSSAVSGSLVVGVPLPSGTVTGSSTITSSLVVGAPLPAGSVTGSSTVAGSVTAQTVSAVGGHWSIPARGARKGLGAFDGDEDDESALLTALLLTLA